MEMTKYKSVKRKMGDGLVEVPLGVDAVNVDLQDGKNLEEALEELNTTSETVNVKLEQIEEKIENINDVESLTDEDIDNIFGIKSTLQIDE